MAVVTLDRLTKRYERGQGPAVDEVSLSIAHGELMVLLGPSGCGKSTTLRMIAGLEAISSGTLAIGGKRVNEVPAKDRDIAMVFQSYALYPHMTVADNLAFGLRRRGFAREEIARRVTDAAAALGLSELLGRKPHALSGGQRQRVALGRAMVRDPAVFLFDEPLSNLDAALRASTRQELARLHQRLGATMIYVTHDQIEAMTLGDRICVMNAGKVVQVGPPLEVYKNPANLFVARFLGAPPMNLIEAPVADGSIRLDGTDVDLTRLATGGPARPRVTVGFRPESIRLGETESSGGLPLAGTARLVEHLGAETILTVALADGAEILVRASGDVAVARGQPVRVAVPLDDIHLFDPATGEAIARASAR